MSLPGSDANSHDYLATNTNDMPFPGLTGRVWLRWLIGCLCGLVGRARLSGDWQGRFDSRDWQGGCDSLGTEGGERLWGLCCGGVSQHSALASNRPVTSAPTLKCEASRLITSALTLNSLSNPTSHLCSDTKLWSNPTNNQCSNSKLWGNPTNHHCSNALKQPDQSWALR